MRKILTLIAALSLVASLAVGGSIAYLQDAEQAVNTMTLGNVDIDQTETDRSGNQFEQNQPMYPIIGEEADNDNDGYWDNNNVIDKKVTVTNTGSSDAYVRTLYAFEIGDMDEKYLNINWETGIDPQKIGTITINGETYMLYSVTYSDALAPDASVTGLKQVALDYTAGNDEVKAVSGDSLYQILVVSQAVQAEGFEAVKDAEGNVTKSAAKNALDTAFGVVSADSHPWLDWDGKSDAEGDQDPDIVLAKTTDDLVKALAEGGYVKLANDIQLEKITPIESGAEAHLDLNGKTITVKEDTASNTLLWVKDGAKLVVSGNGTIDLGKVSTMAIFCPYGELVIENGTFKRDKVTNVTDATTGLFMGAKNSGCNVTINGGYFDPGYYDTNAADIEEILAGTKEFTETADDTAKRGKPGDANLVRVAVKDNVSVVLNHSGYGSFKVYGGTFVGANPAWGDEGCMLPTTPNYLRPWSYYQGALLAGQTYNETGLVIPNGYTITKEMNSENVPVYTVNYNK